jgi:hypothetical protein
MSEVLCEYTVSSIIQIPSRLYSEVRKKNREKARAFWNSGTLELWNSGTLELWNSGTLTSFGMLYQRVEEM